jgi:uncharacterized caspase-like protein
MHSPGPPISLPIALLLIAALAAPATAQKKRGVRVKPQTTTQPARFNGKAYDDLWGVVIGVNNYRNWERLEYAVNDAHSVKTMLVTRFGFRDDHVIELLDEEASLVNIRTTLGGVLPRKTKKNDGVVVFFAGHGETVDLPDGGNLGYIVPWDGSTDQNDYFATLLPMTQIREICALIPAKHIFFIVDACYSGLAATAERGMTAETRVYVSKLATMKSRQILTAGGRGEPVVENAEWGHSAFTYKLLEALETGAADQDRDGVITSGEIATYLRGRVMKLTENRQTPQFRNLSADEGEFLFILRDTAAAAQESRDAAAGGEDPDRDAMKKELERLKAENEQLRKQQEEQQKQPPADEKKKDVFIPPP